MVTYFDSNITRSVYLDFEMYFPLIAAKAVKFTDIGFSEYEVECENLSDEDTRSIFVYDDLDKTLRRRMYLSSNELTSDQWAAEFGYKLNRAIRIARLSQEEFANKLGVSRATVSRYINGKYVPSYLVMIDMANILGCSVDDLRNF